MKNEVSLYLENISLILLGILFVAFPFIFTTITTDPFIIPKQILLTIALIIVLILFGAKMISDGRVRLRKTPFNTPLILFILSVFFSSILAINRYDSIIAFVPLLFGVLAYFLIINTLKKENSVIFLLSSLIVGGCIVSALSVLTFFKIYILPFPLTRIQTFTPFGSFLDQVIYSGALLAISGYFLLYILKVFDYNKLKKEELFFGFSFFVILGGFVTGLYRLVTLSQGQGGFLSLPFKTGYQTALAVISQDSSRTFQSLLFGSGFGTYVADFTRFKLADFNLDPTLWTFTFFRSSSFVLELLATAGLLGILTFIFILFRLIKVGSWKEKLQFNPIFFSLILLAIASFLLPFSFIAQTILFLFLGLFAAIEGVNPKNLNYYDVDLHFSTSKNTIISLSTTPIGEGLRHSVIEEKRSLTKFLPVTFFILFAIFSGLVGFFAVRFIISDTIFQKSLVAANSNNALETYNNQINTISIFPYRDVYYRVYSQTNLALANSLAASQNGGTLSAQTQQTIYTLIQQSIKAGQSAAGLSPQTVLNWQNLSSIYRGLIGFGQNAENFAIASAQQAILLDPNNPQEYINLGGIYYQLGQWDNAQRQFQIAISLKPDFANAYYNLGHALENKGDLQNALTAYQTVKTLVLGNSETSKKITEEIDTLQKKIGTANSAKQENQQATQKIQQVSPNQNINLNRPPTQLPAQQTPVQIPAPQTATSSGR